MRFVTEKELGNAGIHFIGPGTVARKVGARMVRRVSTNTSPFFSSTKFQVRANSPYHVSQQFYYKHHCTMTVFLAEVRTEIFLAVFPQNISITFSQS